MALVSDLITESLFQTVSSKKQSILDNVEGPVCSLDEFFRFFLHLGVRSSVLRVTRFSFTDLGFLLCFSVGRATISPSQSQSDSQED